MPEQRSRAELLDARLAEVEAYWLDVRCACGVGTFYPCRLLAVKCGAGVRVQATIRRLVCRTCGKRPATVAITDDARGAVPSLVGERSVPWKMQLLG